MQYMLLIYHAEDRGFEPTVEQFRAGMDAHYKLMEETRQKGILISAQPLKPTATAKTVRLQPDMKTVVTDGPFAETKEQLAGYYLLDCTEQEALEYAKKIPVHCAVTGRLGSVEVRPILEFSEIRQQFEALAAQQHA